MSLTRDEWARMWESIKMIEQLLDGLHTETRKNTIRDKDRIRKEIQFIKNRIQSVVGQME